MVTQNTVRQVRIITFATAAYILSGCVAPENQTYFNTDETLAMMEIDNGIYPVGDPLNDPNSGTDWWGTDGSTGGTTGGATSGSTGGTTGGSTGGSTAGTTPTPTPAPAYPVSPFSPAIAFYALSNSNVQVSGQGGIRSEAAIFANSDVKVQGQATIAGSVYLASSSHLTASGQAKTGAIAQNNLDESKITQFAANVANLTMDAQSSGVKLSSGQMTTITATNKVYVVDVQGDLDLSGQSKLVLNGDDKTVIVLNVHGNISITGKATMEVKGGLTADHVIINNVGYGSDLLLAGNGVMIGTYIATQRGVHLSGKGQLHGAVIGQGSLLITGQGTETSGIYNASFQ